jgi:uncharacterized protein YfaS (alpha-2-macroglobulin family)
MADAAAPMAAAGLRQNGAQEKALAEDKGGDGEGAAPAGVEPTVRQNFADTAKWVACVDTDNNGVATVDVDMPESLTTWKAKVWAMGAGTRCGQGEAEAITTKNVIVRLQAPRFFVEKDLKTKKKVKVVLEIDEQDGAHVSAFGDGSGMLIAIERLAPGARSSKLPGFELPKDIEVDASGEKRVDWRIRVDKPGQIVVRMKAITDEESDAMQLSFPAYVHGMLKTESFCGVIRPDKDPGSATIDIKVPAERKPEQSRLEIRYSPSLACAMVDALPYLVDYPYEYCDASLNRFVPTVITQKILVGMKLDLKAIEKKRTNLNAQEIGDDAARAQQWGGVGPQPHKNPVFDEAEVKRMVQAGLERLAAMQCSDGGWDWWGGWRSSSSPHMTALVVHGLQLARAADVAVVPDMMTRGVAWLKSYQAGQVQELKNFATKTRPCKEKADALDAFTYMVLVDEKIDNKDMREFLYRDRNDLPVYAKAMFGLALVKVKDEDKLKMVVENCDQYLVQDDENQTAYLKLRENDWWWCWYGSEYEAQAYYLKLIVATDPKSEKASRLVKYLLNNRKHATYWNSTRDTAIVLEAFADYVRATKENMPDMTVTVSIDGKAVKEVKIDAENLFSFDNKLVLEGAAVTTGAHKIELARKGVGPLYFNAYLTNFTLEDPITKAGLEIKVNRKVYQLVEVDKKIKAEGAHGQAVDQKVQKYERKEVANLGTLKSGDLVEIELTIDSKNDYEYIMFEDMKAAGFEPVEVRSGYNGNDMGAYVEFRDERVCFFARALARGQHSVSYRLRAEIPGKFSALPAKGSGVYAPELKANSDEIKLIIQD